MKRLIVAAALCAASPMRGGRAEWWDAGFENCAAVRAEREKRGLAAAAQAAKDKAAVDALTSVLGK